MKTIQFPDLIKSGLKVGDKVYSYMNGEGVVLQISEHTYPIYVRFAKHYGTFSRHGMTFHKDAIPSITLTPWNPIIGEPFPFPKWEPKEGEWCAFWDDGDTSFVVAIFETMSDGKYMFKDSGAEWDNCAPISEAMRIFGVKEEGDE